MKRTIIFGTIVIVLGFLISMGPQFLFTLCEHGEGGYPRCHWSGQAELGIGFLIVALGVCMFIFTDPKTQSGLAIGVFLAGLIALFIPNMLIGGCGMMSMQCRKVAFPALTVESVLLLVFSAIMVTIIELKKPQKTTA